MTAAHGMCIQSEGGAIGVVSGPTIFYYDKVGVFESVCIPDKPPWEDQ